MCTCASCTETDKQAGLPDLLGAPISTAYKSGFENWPRGNPAGAKRSAADYAAHVAHGRKDAYKAIRFTPGQAPVFSTAGLNMPIPQAPKLVLDWIAASYAWAPKASVTTIRQVPRLVRLARDLRKAA